MSRIEFADVVADLSWGDTGKGKVTSYLAKTEGYDFVCRWAGGNNAGHTVYVNGKKFKTHLVPSGVFHGIQSIIGPACVVHPPSLQKELDYLKEHGFDTSLVKVSPKAHIVQESHIDYDAENLSKKLGTTSKGIAPCYADKMARTGIRAKEVLPKEMLWDEELYGKILCEGAQGFYLDIDYGNYPYVTSSTTLPYGACSLGIPPQKIRKIFGICKAYDTRSGIDPDFPPELLDDPVLSLIGDLGQEYGVTTGRRRTVNWLNLDKLNNAIQKTGVTHLIINKCDILKYAGKFRVIESGEPVTMKDFDSFKKFVRKEIDRYDHLIENVVFSEHPEML